MGLIDLFLSRLRATVGYEQSFDDKVQAGDISGALGMMSTDREQIAKAIKEYNTALYPINEKSTGCQITFPATIASGSDTDAMQTKYSGYNIDHVW